jgi:hypothetical protein
MNYDLTKGHEIPPVGEGQMFALHEAFPESDQIVSVISYREYVYAGETKHEKSYAPTLEELIEACGNGFFELVRSTNYTSNKQWQAYAEVDGDVCFGSTPAEAVARLWLALNRKEE